MRKADFVLASASPRRRQLLQQIGAHFYQHPVDVDESHMAGENAEDYVLRLALTKAGAAVDGGGLAVLGADTTVVVGDSVLGKPVDEEQAVEMLMRLSGRSHRVLTAIAMVRGEQSAWRISDTRVSFAHLTESCCRDYWRTGEPIGKAGAYAVQGYGAVFVEKIEGSYSGVVGLPLLETRQLLDQFAISYWCAAQDENVS